MPKSSYNKLTIGILYHSISVVRSLPRILLELKNAEQFFHYVTRLNHTNNFFYWTTNTKQQIDINVDNNWRLNKEPETRVKYSLQSPDTDYGVAIYFEVVFPLVAVSVVYGDMNCAVVKDQYELQSYERRKFGRAWGSGVPCCLPRYSLVTPCMP